jgi:RimJ/RimL family protein N-acetyltransferase
MDARAVSDTVADWGIESPRIAGRLVDARDRALYRALYTDPVVMAHIGPALDEAAADTVFEQACGYNCEQPMRARYWRLSDRVSDKAIGVQSMLRRTSEPGVIELGLMLLPERQGQRYGLEIAEAMLSLLFEDRWELGATTVTALHAPANHRVGRLGVSLRFESDAPDDAGTQVWRMTRSAWLRRRAR